MIKTHHSIGDSVFVVHPIYRHGRVIDNVTSHWGVTNAVVEGFEIPIQSNSIWYVCKGGRVNNLFSENHVFATESDALSALEEQTNQWTKFVTELEVEAYNYRQKGLKEGSRAKIINKVLLLFGFKKK